MASVSCIPVPPPPSPSLSPPPLSKVRNPGRHQHHPLTSKVQKPKPKTRPLSTAPGIISELWEKLPREIAIYIWQLAALGPPRLVHLTLPGERVVKRRGAPPYLASQQPAPSVDEPWLARQEYDHFWTRETLRTISSWPQASSLVPPSSVAGVCRQARYAASKVCGQGIADPARTWPTIWFTPENDTLFLSESTLHRIFSERFLFDHHSGLDRRRVQNLALTKACDLPEHYSGGISYWRSGLRWVAMFLRKFPNLKKVTFVAEYFTPADVMNLVMMDLHDIDRLTSAYRRGYRTAHGSRVEDIPERTARHQEELRKIRSMLARESQHRKIPQIELGAITTPERRDAFYEAREAYFHARDNYRLMLRLVEMPQPGQKVDFCAGQGSKVQDMIIWFRFLKRCFPEQRLAVLMKGVRLHGEEKLLDIPFLREGETFDIVIADREQKLPRFVGYRSQYN